jgi:WD40 repeat protein
MMENLPHTANDPWPPLSLLQRVDEVSDRFEDAWEAGQQPRIEEYLAEIPEPGRPALLRELLALELRYRRREGETPAPAEYQRRFPGHAGVVDDAFLKEPSAAAGGERTPPEGRSVCREDQPEPRPGLRSRAGTGSPELSLPETGPTATGTRRTVAGYEVLGQLGRGGMGVVYRARHVRLDRVVALKMIRAGASASPEELARFRDEAALQARFHHPHIVQIFEVGDTTDGPYFALEYVDGGSLAHKTAGTPQPARAAAGLVETLARAIQYAHQKGLVHRDLKPANILLTCDGTPKVGDFGLAKRLDGDAGWSKTGDVLGTPSYMAPEQTMGNPKEVGPLADVYALGVILYELLTGQPPFKGETTLDTVLLVRGQDPVPPRRLQPKVPADLQTICLKCLRKEPARRYASAEALADDLRAFLDGRPIQARPAGRVERLWRWGRRNPGLAVTGSLAALALVAVTVVSIFFAVRETSHAQDLAKALGAEAAALQEKAVALQAETEYRRQAEYRLAENYLDQGQNLCQQGRVVSGVLRMAYGLNIAPAGADDLRRVIAASLGAWRPLMPSLRARLSHTGPVLTVAVSPDGTLLLTGSADKTAQLWNAATGQPIGKPLRHGQRVTAVAFHPDGRLVLTGSWDKTAQLWDVATGTSVNTFRHRTEVDAVAFSPDGKVFVTGCRDGKAYLWEPSARGKVDKELRRLEERGHTKPIRAVAFSPNGRQILTGSADNTALVWDTDTGQRIGELLRQHGTGTQPAHNGPVRAVAVSPDGQTFLTASEDRHIRLWDAATCKPRGKDPEVLYEGILAVAFNPKDEGRTFLTGGGDGTVTKWETATKKKQGKLLGHSGEVLAVAFCPDGQTVLTGSEDTTAQLCAMAHEHTAFLTLVPEKQVRVVAFQPDGRTALTARWTKVQMWDTTQLKGVLPRDIVSYSVPSPEGGIQTAALSPDGKKALVARANGTVHLFDVKTAEELLQFPTVASRIRAVTLSPDGRFALTGSSDAKARLWDLENGAQVGQPLEHNKAVRAVAFNRTGRLMATGSDDTTARLWDRESAKEIGMPFPHPGRVLAVAMSPDDRFILTGCADGAARLWDRETGKVKAALLHDEPVRAVSYSRDGTHLLTASDDATARLWDPATGKPIGPPFRHADPVKAAVFSPTGQTFLTAAGAAHVWEVHPPAKGEGERYVRWIQVLTGMELVPNGEAVRLNLPTWQERRQRLDDLGGPPLP